MVLALLSGASPKTCKMGPTVRLPKGEWRFGVHGIVDSELIMHVEGYESTNSVKHDQRIVFDVPTEITLSFSVRGSEQYITALAERIQCL